MAPTSATCSTNVLKHVCKLMEEPIPEYKYTAQSGGILSYVKVMNSQYVGKICGSSADARASAASNALMKIIEGNSNLTKDDELVQAYLRKLDDDHTDEVQVRKSGLCEKYVEALTSMRDVKVEVLYEAMKKHACNDAEREKFVSMSNKERTEWLATLSDRL